MTKKARHPLIAGTVVTSLGTLVCRGLGLLRDMVTASMFGLSSTAVADAFWFAYRIPNLFRQLFGEGAMTASFLPVLTIQLEHDSHTAWKLASVVVTLLSAILSVLVALGELVIALVWFFWGDSIQNLDLLAGLSAVMLPYLFLICIAAQLTTILNAAQRFSVAALAPTMLNLVWLAAAWFVAPFYAGNEAAQAYVLAVAVLISGLAQIVVQLPAIRKLGFRFDFHWTPARQNVLRIVRNMAPMMFGLAVTQINTFADSLIAWGLSASPDGPQTIAWLGDVAYPMQQGAVAAIYFGDRLCEFPLGLIGMAVAVAIFPLLSRHAARGDFRKLGDDMTLGLRLVFCLALPASAGLFILAHPVAELLFQHGKFHPEDTIRAARMVAWYGTGVWAYCESAVLVRGFYSLNDYRTPVRLAAWMVTLNLTLNLILIWPMAEAGLAVSTSVTDGLRVLILMAIFSRRLAHLDWLALSGTTLRTLASTLIMTVVVYLVLGQIPDSHRLTTQFLRLFAPLSAGLIAYCAAYLLLGGRELGMLLHGKSDE
jgi:putative peptidoglycan lipid II flippase